MSSLKDKFYNFIVRKNERVRIEYESYVNSHLEEHHKNRMKHWQILMKINWHYRILRKTTPLVLDNKSSLATSKSTSKSTSKAFCRTPLLINNPNCFSESQLTKRDQPHWMVMSLITYDVISFDIFDTLVLRPFDNPKSVFMLIGQKLGVSGFRNIRINAEKEARDIKEAEFGNREINIYDIYNIIAVKTGIDVEYGVQTELQVEIDMCYANPYMKRVYDILLYQNKKIILTSDMYLPSDMLRKILISCGYEGYDDLIVSCENSANKSGGMLYEYVKKKHCGRGERIIHIGDNINGDVNKAKEHNVDVVFYSNCCQVGAPYRPCDMSVLIGSAYRGIVNNHLHNSVRLYSPQYEHGFTVGGIFVTGYVNWVHEYTRIRNIDKIVFVSRDGDIYKKVYDRFFNDIKSEYIYWSRIASEFTTVKYERMSFINRFINEKISYSNPVFIGEMFKLIGIDFLIKRLSKYSLDADLPISNDTRKPLTNFIADNWDDIVAALENRHTNYMDYLKKAIGNSKHVALVDVGWTGTNICKLKMLIEKELGVLADCLLAGFTSVSGCYLELDHTITPYVFSCQTNKSEFNAHHVSKKPINNLFEIISQATYPSFCGIENGKFEFDLPEVENYQAINEIHQGILDFSDLWMKCFSSYKYMYNISGYDAYAPFKHRIEDLRYFKMFFGNFTVATKVLFNDNNGKLETISNII